MKKNKRWVWGIGFLILLPIFFLKISVVSFAFEDKTYYLQTDSFQLKWIHSVEKEAWIENYEKKGTNLLLTTTQFKTFGAGVPYTTNVSQIENGFVSMDVNRTYPELFLTVSDNVKTTIVSNNKEIPLYDYAPNYEVVHISIQYIHIWTYLGGNFL